MNQPRLVAFLIVPPFVLLDLAGPLDAFHAVIRNVAESGKMAPYRTVVVSEHGGPVETGSGITLHTEPMRALEAMQVDTLIAVGGAVAHRPAVPDAVGEWLRDYAPRVRRVCSVCVGAFILGAAGLLNGRRATTHWLDTAMLQTCFPEARVESDPIYVRDEPVWTSAGITAGIDLGLALVEDDCGVDVALQAARRLVVFLKRAGGQSQFSPPLQEQVAAGGAVRGFARVDGAAAGRRPVGGASGGAGEHESAHVCQKLPRAHGIDTGEGGRAHAPGSGAFRVARLGGAAQAYRRACRLRRRTEPAPRVSTSVRCDAGGVSGAVRDGGRGVSVAPGTLLGGPQT